MTREKSAGLLTGINATIAAFFLTQHGSVFLRTILVAIFVALAITNWKSA